MDRCILSGYDNVMCSKGTYMDFFSIMDVSGKIEKYDNVSFSIEKILANSTNCSYAIWASEQLNRSRSINEIDEALKVIYNISVSDLLAEDCVKKAPPVIVQNETNETVASNTTTGTKNGTGAVSTQSNIQATEMPLLAILVIAVIIAAAAYFIFSRKKKDSGYSRFNK
jgi:hypothetical protein